MKGQTVCVVSCSGMTSRSDLSAAFAVYRCTGMIPLHRRLINLLQTSIWGVLWGCFLADRRMNGGNQAQSVYVFFATGHIQPLKTSTSLIANTLYPHDVNTELSSSLRNAI